MNMLTGHVMDDLLAVLSRERQILERVLYRVLQTASLLVANETRFLHWLALDIERVTEHLREIDLQRSIVTVGLEDLNSLDEDRDFTETMSGIAATAPTPYQFLLQDHQDAMRSLVREIGVTVANLRDTIHLKLDAIAATTPRRTSHNLDIGKSDNMGDLDPLDREILTAGFGAVLNACDRLQLPELVRFLEL